MRPSNRAVNELRSITFERAVSKHAEGSCLVKFGDTHVLCTATIDRTLPAWLRHSGKGWISAEYGMLPRSTHSRMKREASQTKQSGRTLEIQRLIGRALRAVTNLNRLGEMQILIDCDVIQADGGTRTAAISGAWVALYDALKTLQDKQIVRVDSVLTSQVAAVSCGIYKGSPVLDLDYAEDSQIDCDVNFVMTDKGSIVEVQGTAEGQLFSKAEFDELFNLASAGIADIITKQRQAIEVR